MDKAMFILKIKKKITATQKIKQNIERFYWQTNFGEM
jgi:hypothetical protein